MGPSQQALDGSEVLALGTHTLMRSNGDQEETTTIDADFPKAVGIKHLIIQAPMAGGLSTPELAAAVGNAGGMGSLAGAYLTPDGLIEEYRRIRSLTSAPVNINLFAGGYGNAAPRDPGPMLSVLGEIHEFLGLPPPVVPALPPDPFPEQLEAVLEIRPAVFSFTFGIPSGEVIRRLHQRGILTMGTATTVAEAQLLEQSGVKAIVAQGAEAGAHRGTFLKPSEESMVPTAELVPAIRHAVAAPIIAAGGLMDGHDIARILHLGAGAAQLGTAFLLCPEAGTPTAYRRAILSAQTDTTVITRAFSGRPARGLRNAFIEKLQRKESHILPYPLQNALTRPMRAAAAKAAASGYLSLWAGQGGARARALPAAQLVGLLIADLGYSAPAR